MSAKYECNPLAVDRAVSNLRNIFQAMGSLQKAKNIMKLPWDMQYMVVTCKDKAGPVATLETFACY